MSWSLAVAVIGFRLAGGSTISFDEGWSFQRGDCTTAPSDTCASADFDSGAWRVLNVPHDWSIEDLPSRESDREFPVLGVRYGKWKLRAGDNPAYASPTYSDSDWLDAQGGVDW